MIENDKYKKIEGRMDIWYDNAASGKNDYQILFVPYRERIKPLRQAVTGDDELENFLLAAGFETDAAKGWLKDVRTFWSVSIDNVPLPQRFLNSQPQEDAGPNHRNALSTFLPSWILRVGGYVNRRSFGQTLARNSSIVFRCIFKNRRSHERRSVL